MACRPFHYRGCGGLRTPTRSQSSQHDASTDRRSKPASERKAALLAAGAMRIAAIVGSREGPRERSRSNFRGLSADCVADGMEGRCAMIAGRQEIDH